MLSYWKRLVGAVRFYNTGQEVDEDGYPVGEELCIQAFAEMRERGVRYPVPYFVTRYKEKAKRAKCNRRRGFFIDHVDLQSLRVWGTLAERPRNTLSRRQIDTVAKLVDLSYADMRNIGLSPMCINNIHESGILAEIWLNYCSESIDCVTFWKRFYDKE